MAVDERRPVLSANLTARYHYHGDRVSVVFLPDWETASLTHLIPEDVNHWRCTSGNSLMHALDSGTSSLLGLPVQNNPASLLQ
ncbi:hypothetical protein CHARACLAT_030939 [Characodon lateralis]|uniref:Uncharacterized protein n=1 Tax=Characodon lateralis TaxID=208331 RepID=A0ABU7F1H4_9TELE|nr:hypothetical protein [Characodon lateralis]